MSSRIRFLIPPTVLAIALCIAGHFSTVVQAGGKFQPVSPEELKLTKEPLAPGAPAIILFRQVDRDDTGNTAHEDVYFRIKILTEEGRKYADIEIPFNKDREDVVNVKARTIQADGTIVNFEGKPFEKTIAKAQGLKYLAKTFTLSQVQVGSIIEYYFTRDLSEHYIFDSRWILSHELFTKGAKFSLRPYDSSSDSFALRWSTLGLPLGTIGPKEGPDRVIRLETSNIPAFPTEDFMPPENELKARVDFFYSEEAQETNQAKFWFQHGKKLKSQLEKFVGRPSSFEQAVAQIVAPTDPPVEKLRKIYAKVQQIRNTSYEVQKTEQQSKREKEKEASNVEDVWKKGYGNGTQLTWLYLALVRAAGFEAYGAWVSDRSNYFFNPVLLDSSRLNANVVVVKLDGKDFYADPGAAFTPFGLLTWSETGVTGLRLDKEGGSWLQTTLPSSSASRVERTANLKLSETGDLEGKLILTFTGLEAMQRRVRERNVDEEGRKKFLEDAVKDYIPVANEAELVNKPDWKDSTMPLVAEFNLKVPGWASNAGRRALIPVGLFSASEKHVFDHTDRVHPIYFDYPFEKVDDINIEVPAGWKISSLPAAQNQDGKVVFYSLKVENNNGKLHLSRKLVVSFLLIEARYYGALRDFFQTVRTGDEEQIVLQIGTAVTSN